MAGIKHLYLPRPFHGPVRSDELNDSPIHRRQPGEDQCHAGEGGPGQSFAEEERAKEDGANRDQEGYQHEIGGAGRAQDAEAVLGELLDFGPDDLAALRTKGVI